MYRFQGTLRVLKYFDKTKVMKKIQAKLFDTQETLEEAGGSSWMQLVFYWG